MRERYQVVVVGAGPVGTLLANLLGRRGVSVCVIEKQARPFGLPRAIHFDGEAMRVFQTAGLAEQVLPSTMVGRGMLFKDKDNNTLIDWSRAQEIGPMGWYESYRVHQPQLEQTLLDGLARFDHATLKRGVAVTGVEQNNESATVILADGTRIVSDYVVGCDGATSPLRDMLEIKVDDLGYHERWFVVDLLLKRPRDDLGDYSIQFCDAENPATYVRGVGDRRRWEMRLKPEEPDVVSEQLAWQKLARWIGPDDAELERSAVYTFRSCIAEQWRKGRCFLAGDAAHQMPPFMGQGMCAGIRDAANLEWKIDHVLRGGDALMLDSYFSERQLHVRQFIELTVRLGKLINQTAAGNAPLGKMKSIWPSLGEGISRKDGIGGELAPQMRMPDGMLADDFAEQGFYLLALDQMKADLPVVVGDWPKLRESGFKAAVIRPDGYALAGVNKSTEITTVMQCLNQ